MTGPTISVDDFTARRARVAADLPDDGVLVVATHPEALFSNDVMHRFRPHSDFWYLTGFGEPGSVLVLDGSGRADLFVRPRDPAAEVWHGRRAGVERAGPDLGFDAAHDIDDFSRWFRDRVSGVGRDDVVAIAAHDPWTQRRIRKWSDPLDGGALLASHRVIKDDAEIAMMQHACDLSVAAHEAARDAVRPGADEYGVEAALEGSWRAGGSTGPAYPPIVGAGDNASILHYIENRATIAAGDAVLIDAGCEWGHYAADITRTWFAGDAPDAHWRLHDVVVEAQRAAVAAVKPGVRIREVHDVACRVLIDGLVAAGVLSSDDDVEAHLKADAHRPYYMHGTSHYLGLDVHDAGDYRDPDEPGGPDRARGPKSRRLEPGMVITVEPGLYFNADFAPESPRHLRGLGIRIEDDILVTEDGNRNLSGALPVAA